MVAENTTRKIDTMGRISIPKSLRDRFGLESGAQMAFFTKEIDGKFYILMIEEEGEED